MEFTLSLLNLYKQKPGNPKDFPVSMPSAVSDTDGRCLLLLFFVKYKYSEITGVDCN